MNEELDKKLDKEVVEIVEQDTTLETPVEEVSPEGVPAVVEVPPVVFPYGDLYVSCSACGKESLLSANIPGGISFDLYSTDKHTLRLVCPACESSHMLFFKEAANPPKEEENDVKGIDLEQVQEAASATTENSGAVESTESGSVQEEAGKPAEKEEINEPVSKDSTSEVQV